MMQSIYLRAYLAGYSGRHIPRSIRRVFAGSALHRAWLLGSMGFFEQDGIRYSPAHPYGIGTEPERA